MRAFDVIITCHHCGERVQRKIFRKEKPKVGERIDCPDCPEDAIIYAVINKQTVDNLDER